MSSNPPAAATEPRGDLKSRVQSLQLPKQPATSWTSSAGWLVCLLLLLTNAAAGYVAWRYYQQVQVAGASAAQTTEFSGVGGGTNAGGDRGSGAKAPPPAAAGGSPNTEEIALQATGYIIPAHQILVSPKVSGMLTRLDVEEGKRFKQGDVLAEIERTEYEAEYERASAAVAAARERLHELETGSRQQEISQAQAELEEAREVCSQLEETWSRVRTLFEQRAASDEEFNQAERQYKAQCQRVRRLQYVLELLEEGPREERIAAARAEVKEQEAELVRAKWRLDNCTILAPISGTILKKNAEEGNIVNPVAFNGSFSVCDMADLSDLEVDLAIQERDVRRVFQGQKCRIRATAYLDRNYDGFVARLMPIADRAKGAVPVRVKILVPAEEEGVYLKPEMTAEVTFFAGEAETPAGTAHAVLPAATDRPEQVVQ